VARKRILIVDDDRLVAETLRTMVTAQGDVDVQVITDGPQAAALLQTEPLLDAVICDLTMPGIDGITLYEALGRRGSPLARRFLLVTGGVVTDAASRFLAARAVPYLQKPFDGRQLQKVLAPLLDHSPDEPA
jgi:CheY-like chemotaxis protein